MTRAQREKSQSKTEAAKNFFGDSEYVRDNGERFLETTRKRNFRTHRSRRKQNQYYGDDFIS